MVNDFGMWEAFNVLCRLAVALFVILKLTMFYEEFKREERLGLGVLGGCSLMTIPVLIEGPSSPFAEWAGALFTFGVLVYLGGRLRRLFLHRLRNREQIRRAKERGIGL